MGKQTFGKVKKGLAILLAVLFLVSVTAASVSAKCGASYSDDDKDSSCKSCDKDPGCKSCAKDKSCKDKSCKDKKTCGKDKHKHKHKHKHSHKKHKCPYSN